MENVRPEGTEYQYVTSPSGETLERNNHVRRSERIRKSTHRYEPVFGAAIEWKNYAVTSIVYMIEDGYLNSNVDTEYILSFLYEWYAEYFIDAPSTFHMREYYVLKYQIHDPDNPTYMEALSGENSEEYYKAMDDEIQSLMRRDTHEIVSRKSVSDHNVLPITWYLKCKSKPD